jgi:hypothetical protein
MTESNFIPNNSLESTKKLLPSQFMTKIGFTPDKPKNRDYVEVKNTFIETKKDSLGKTTSVRTLFCTPKGFEIVKDLEFTSYDVYGIQKESFKFENVMEPIDMNKI